MVKCLNKAALQSKLAVLNEKLLSRRQLWKPGALEKAEKKVAVNLSNVTFRKIFHKKTIHSGCGTTNKMDFPGTRANPRPALN